MSSPNITLPIDSLQNITDPPVRSKIGRISEWYSSGGTAGCNSFWRHAALVVPSALLLLYLGFQARRNLKKLRHRKSYVIIAYYALLWASALLNFVWSILQVGFRCFFFLKLWIQARLRAFVWILCAIWEHVVLIFGILLVLGFALLIGLHFSSSVLGKSS